ncbi:MAG: adenylate/guanylate cyclase domain-containing protein [Chloroflexi bacterium]|nr:MAG: adenylate/guanylate cyclase domain-containing protein [Chloroflexota bacterium]
MTLPTGTVTFLFTDIEGSTRLMQQLGQGYVELQMVHHELLREAFRSNEGRELRTEGDSFFCVFASALDACHAAAAAQQSFAEHRWPEGGALRVRIGLHTGEAPLMGDEYIGLDVHHAARIAGAAYGGQVLVSEATQALVAGRLPERLQLRDLGLHRLRDLAGTEHLYQLLVEGVPDVFPALRTLDGTPNNLPTQLTSFVGRSEMVARAKRLVETSRLLTLTGPGGIGKTRLSLQVAAETFDQFPDGVYFIALSAVRDPEVIPSVIAQAIGIPMTGNRLPLDMVIEHLRNRKTLLVIDNFEQLLPEAAGFPSTLLQASPNLKVIVSSRAPLRAYGEHEFPVEPLLIPDSTTHPSLDILSQYEAVKLFIERATAAKPDFYATNENAPAIAGICERVDGLPLAIELAAARIKLFSPQALYSRLEKSFSALGVGARDLPSRQQTLTGAIAWSYDMLDAPGRRLLARFSVFARGAGLEQAGAVCGPADEVGGDVVTGLDELADQSLLRRVPDVEEPRLLMLQTIREFGAERLQESGEAEVIRDRHAEAFAAMAEEVEGRLLGSERKAQLDRLARDHDNLRAALDWCISGHRTELALRLASAMWRFWQMRGHLHEGRSRIEAVLDLPGVDKHPAAHRRALEAAGGIAYWQADMHAAQAWYDDCLVLTRATGDKNAIANAIYNDSFPLVVGRTDMARALPLLDEALGLFRELDDAPGIARCLWGIGNVHHFLQDYDAAVPPLEESIELFRKLGQGFGLGWSLHTRALVAINLGDPTTAQPLVTEALGLFSKAGDVSGIMILLDDSAQIARLREQRLRSLRLAGAAAGMQARSGAQLATLANAIGGRPVAVAEDAEERKAFEAGQAMTPEDAVAYALDQG